MGDIGRVSNRLPHDFEEKVLSRGIVSRLFYLFRLIILDMIKAKYRLRYQSCNSN